MHTFTHLNVTTNEILSSQPCSTELAQKLKDEFGALQKQEQVAYILELNQFINKIERDKIFLSQTKALTALWFYCMFIEPAVLSNPIVFFAVAVVLTNNIEIHTEPDNEINAAKDILKQFGYERNATPHSSLSFLNHGSEGRTRTTASSSLSATC